MQTIIGNDEILDFNLENLVEEFQLDVLYLCPSEIEQAEYELLANQYAYIKFGLILEKFRNQSWWKRCNEQFRDFKDFCTQKVHLSRWQVVNAIKSANVAIRLVFLGFSNLPRNASQALLNQYLEQLAEGQSPDGSREVEIEPPTDEEIACIEKLALEWKSGNNQSCSNQPKSKAIIDKIDLTLGGESDPGEVIAIASTS
jgi:hypothetical protein